MAEDVPADPIPSPPLEAIPRLGGRIRVGRLPMPLTSFVGREHDEATVSELLRRPNVRLATLIGPAGVGKTRLALAVARRLAANFRDGAVFITLESVKEATLAPVRIAQQLAILDDGQRAEARLRTALSDQHLLLVLDNFEQVLDAAPMLNDLLAGCPDLKILVTSRARLNLSGEHVYALTPLALPAAEATPTAEEAAKSAAIRLFVERAAAVDAAFTLTTANVAAVVTLCRRLDGLPLAIELAAARSGSFAPPDLSAGLTDRLELLTGGPRDMPARMRTMREAVAWSENLLTDEERMFFRRVAVFAGGFTLEAVAAVAAGRSPPDAAAFALLGSLIDKSLLYRMTLPGQGSPRFGMLETIREFALERLEAAGETERVRHRHAAYFHALAEAAEARRTDLSSAAWISLSSERDNLRAALTWLAHHGETELMLRTAGALWPLWLEQGGIGPGRRQIATYLALPEARAHPAAWSKAAGVAAAMAQAQGDHEQAVELGEQALAIASKVSDDRAVGMAATALGLVALVEGDFDRAAAMLEAGGAAFRAAGDARVLWTLRHLGSVAFLQRDLPRAVRLAEEGLALALAAGNDLDAARMLQNLSVSLAVQGRLDRAIAMGREAVRLFQVVGEPWGIADALATLGHIAHERGDDNAGQALEQSLAMFRGIGDAQGLSLALLGAAWEARARGAAVEAQTKFEEVLALADDRTPGMHAVSASIGLGALALDRNDLPRAAARLGVALRHARARRDPLLIASALERFARLAAEAGEPRHAARFLAVGAMLRAAIGAPPPPSEALALERLAASVRDALGPAAFAAASAAAPAATPDQPQTAPAGVTIVTAALREAVIVAESVAAPDAERATEEAERARLTEREREVLRLLVEGVSDREIAGALSLSYRTVTTHVTAILNKLGVESRTAAAVYAVRHGLA